MTKKLLSILALLCMTVSGAWAWSGSGTSASPYLITSAADLNTLASGVNGGNSYSGMYFKLTADITYSASSNWNAFSNTDSNFTPIGNWDDGKLFSGTFDGDGHTISGIRIYSSKNGTGLFGKSNGTIKNLTLSNCRITGIDNVGGIVGIDAANISDCHVSSTVAIVSQKDDFGEHGGIKGQGGGTIERCTSSATITYISGTANKLRNAGGIVGRTSGTVRDCAAIAVKLPALSKFQNPSSDYYHTVGAIAGSCTGTCTNNRYISCQMGGAAQASGIGIKNADDDNCKPAFNGKSGADAANAYEIGVLADWLAMAQKVSGGETYSGKFFKMTADITLTPSDAWNTFSSHENNFVTAGNSGSSFCGTFDGDSHTFSGIRIYHDGNSNGTALFGSNRGTVKNLIVTNSRFSGSHNTAAIVGLGNGARGTIENCRVTETVAIVATANCSDIGVICGQHNIITGCYSAGTIYLNGFTVERVGGITGGNAQITNCIANGVTLTGTTAGAIVGNASYSTLSNNYYTACTVNSATSNVGTSTGDISGVRLARTISAGTDVTISGLGDATTTYSVSGITAYATGLKYSDAYYAGNGESVGLTLSHGDKTGYTFNQYAVSGGGTLNAQTETSATLVMTDADQTVSVQWTQNTATLTDGNDLTALSAWAGKTCTVTYTRSFTSGKASTVCLPFDYAPKTGETFYTFSGITKSGSDYVATMTEAATSPLTANTPYLFMPTGNADFSGTYEIPASLTAGETTSGDWTFKGTYTTISWTEAPTGIYGFSAQDVAADGISQGQFVKVGTYVRIKPMRAYLEYTGSDSQFKARALTRAAATDEDETLPETIKVRLIGADGTVTAIGTLHTRTGEVSFDPEAWYTLDGKRLAGQPTQKGIYVNNGKKVVIK